MMILKNASKQFYFFIALALCACVFFSCARGDGSKGALIKMSIEIKFKDINTHLYNYIVILSKSSRSKLPAIPANTAIQHDLYLPLPGRSYDDAFVDEIWGAPENGITHFYQNYLSNWMDYFLISKESLALYRSESDNFSATTTDTFAYSKDFDFTPESFSINHATNTIHIQYQVQDLSVIPTTLYLSVATQQVGGVYEFESAESGFLMDKLDSLLSIKIASLEQEEVEDLEESILPAANILSLKVRID